jgi:hypothetical protein
LDKELDKDFKIMEEGREWWRRKVGRPRIYASPDELNQDCEDYLIHTGKRAWVKKDWVGKDAIEVEREVSAPFTLTGLYIYLGIDRGTWEQYRQRPEFFTVITRIEQIIYTQKFEGATVGAFNANIIARDLGLADKREVEKVKKKLTFKDAE